MDLSRILAGPSATQLLGDLGADVTKVEKPDEGDGIAALGMKTSFHQLAQAGLCPMVLIVSETVWIAALVLIAAVMLR